MIGFPGILIPYIFPNYPCYHLGRKTCPPVLEVTPASPIHHALVVEKQPIDETARAFGRWISLEEKFMACDCVQEWNVSGSIFDP